MFIDINEDEVSEELNFDLCIIGGGAAGISLALAMREQNISIALLESGGWKYDQEIQNLNVGGNIGLTYFPLGITRLRYLGGTTNHWEGQSAPLDPVDFLQRSWVPDSGWPISYDEFSPYLKDAEEICGVPCGPYRWDYWRRQADERVSPLSDKIFTDVVFRYSTPARRFGKSFRRDIWDAENITCYLNANVLELVTDSSGENVTTAKIGSLEGKRASIMANKFVLACGGIENSRLLLLSDGVQKNGLGNQNDQVGRYFMEHPNFDSGEVRLSDLKRNKTLAKPSMIVHGAPLRLDFKLNDYVQEKEKILNHSASLRHVVSSDEEKESEDVGAAMKLWQEILGENVAENSDDKSKSAAEKVYMLRVRLEQAPNEESRVLLDSERDAFGLPLAKLDLKIGELEGHTIEVVQNYFANELGHKELGRMKITFNKNAAGWKDKLGWQFHHCGGTRMHDSAEKGVVDRNCRVHGVNNLYVAGSSVFTTSGHANPTMNLVALSLRLADHLKGLN